MNLEVEIPSTDADLIAELLALPGAHRISQENFDGTEAVRIMYEIAVGSTEVAVTTKAAASMAKSAAEIVTSLRSIFRRGLSRHKTDPNGHFVVIRDHRPFLSSDMDDNSFEHQLNELSNFDDWG